MALHKSYLQTTFELRETDGVHVPFQNGIPVPVFDPQQRKMISLGGEWRKRRFEADHDMSMAHRDGTWLAALQKKEGACLHGDTDTWERCRIPAPENRLSGAELAGAAENYENGVWYRREFEIAEADIRRSVTLKALGVNYVADFWINGKWIGWHEGGFTPFAFDVTPYLRTGGNEISVRIDNPPWGSRTDTIPAVEGTDFFNYTGIIQELYLEVTGSVHMARADIVPVDTGGTLRVRVVVHNRGPEPCCIRLRGDIYEADRESEAFLAHPEAYKIKGRRAETDVPISGALEMEGDEVRVLSFRVSVRAPKLWSLGEPNLYVAEFVLDSEDAADGIVSDRLAVQFGIRTVTTDKARILLNGEPVFLAGIARHEEWPGFGRTAAWNRIRTDLEQIRLMNANMVRTGHYPNHLYTYILLDRLGLAAMSEIPLWQFETVHYEVQRERKAADQMWREMVFSQYNRPSVLMWSTQNESKDVGLRLEYNRRLVDDLRQRYDDGRLVTQSAAADQPGFHDPSMEPLDVAAWTMYFGIFHGGTPYEGTKDFLENAHRVFPDKPILNTEFGYWTGQSDEEAEQQLTIYQDTLRALGEKSAVTADGRPNAGGYVAGIDFWIMYNWYVNHNRWIDTFGIYHMDRITPKPIAEQIRRDYDKLSANPLQP